VAVGCKEVTGARDRAGYSRQRSGGKIVYSHRLVWEWLNGPIPNGMYICHHCDNPSCVNPSHLFIGTPTDNQQDCVRKGRKVVRRGAAHPNSKLTTFKVEAIRRYAEQGVKQKYLALEFGVTQQVISKIVCGKIWK